VPWRSPVQVRLLKTVVCDFSGSALMFVRCKQAV
jgi:hypothetical protein